MEDVTARKRAEEALLEAGALQSAIFNSANFSSIATDEKGVIQIFNVGAERMLGYTAAEVMNKITPADISDPQEVIARAEAQAAADVRSAAAEAAIAAAEKILSAETKGKLAGELIAKGIDEVRKKLN
jgi:PAS domain-containing protein